MGEQPVVAGEAGEAARRVDVAGPLADVDVDADPEVSRQAGGGAQRLVGAGEGGMDAHQAPAAGPDEALVLGQAAPGTVGAVAIGDAVGQQRPHPDLGAGGGDDVEAALDGVGRLVVVDDRGGAALERLEGAEMERPPSLSLGFFCQFEAPPALPGARLGGGSAQGGVREDGPGGAGARG